MSTSSVKAWQVRDRFLEMHSRWLTLIGEHIQDDRDATLEYWRIEKADSIIALVIQGDRLLLPMPSYRVGISQITLDFAGGRLAEGKSPIEIVPVILQRELGITNEAIAQIIPLNSEAWAVNSSFSNQKLHGFVVHIEPTAQLSLDVPHLEYALNKESLHSLRQSLTCLQCRALLMEWMLT